MSDWWSRLSGLFGATSPETAKPRGGQRGGGQVAGSRGAAVPAPEPPPPIPLPDDFDDAPNEVYVPRWGGKCYEDEVFEARLIDPHGNTQKVEVPEDSWLSDVGSGVYVVGHTLCYDLAGNVVVNLATIDRKLRVVGGVRERMVVVHDEAAKLHGYLSLDARRVSIKCMYTQAAHFCEGRAMVGTPAGWGFLTVDGRFRSLDVAAGSPSPRAFRENLAAACDGDQWGYVDGDGRWVIRPQFDWAGSFHDGVAIVMNGGRCRFIDDRGQARVPGEFATARPFAEGLAPVMPLAGENRYWGAIDRAGRFVVSPVFDDLQPCCEGQMPFVCSRPANAPEPREPPGAPMNPAWARGRRADPERPRVGLLRVKDGVEVLVKDAAAIGRFSERLAVAQLYGRRYTYIGLDGKVLTRHDGANIAAMLREKGITSDEEIARVAARISASTPPPTYETAFPFREGWALVRTAHM